jgi:asparagine synthase (glutamine-hydrolysing)
MPGIVGVITKKPRERVEPEVRRMVEAMCHDASYRTGTWSEERLGVYVGWVAKAQSSASQMPVQNEDRSVTLVFSGEEFPAPGIRQRLRAAGHSLSANPASYLVHMYEDDPSFPADLNGRFHGLLVDTKRNKITLFNDRFGMHRIYFYESADAFYFAAEAKAILAVRPELRQIDQRSLGEFVSYGCVLFNRTLFKGIEVLPQASAWELAQGAVQSRTSYFHPREWEQQSELDGESYYAAIRDVFSRNLPRYFEREDIGAMTMSLTGGLDTRMITAWGKPAPGELPCFSFGGMFRECQDVQLARRVATALRQPYTVIPVAQEFLSNFSKYAERSVYITDGCVDVYRSPDLFVNEKVAQMGPLRMTGNYGGEVLRRVRAFKPTKLAAPGLFQPEFLRNVDSASQTYDQTRRSHPLSFAVFEQATWHHFGLYALEESQLTVRSPFLDNEFVKTVYRAPQAACESSDVCLRLIADGNADLRKIRTDRGLANEGNPFAPALNAWLEFTFNAEYAYDYGMPQPVAKIDHAFAPLHLERLFLGRHKFSHFRVWYRDALSSYVRDTLLSARSLARPYLNAKVVESMVEGHLRGSENHTLEIHKLLTIEHIHRLFVDSSTVPAVMQDRALEVAG